LKRPANEHPLPTGSDDLLYTVELTEREMQCLSNACSAFYRVTAESGITVSPEQTMALVNALGKMKQASLGGDGRSAIGLVDAEGRRIL
jgi:hypothetical protein